MGVPPANHRVGFFSRYKLWHLPPPPFVVNSDSAPLPQPLPEKPSPSASFSRLLAWRNLSAHLSGCWWCGSHLEPSPSAVRSVSVNLPHASRKPEDSTSICAKLTAAASPFFMAG